MAWTISMVAFIAAGAGLGYATLLSRYSLAADGKPFMWVE
jgi:hypothetical protein